MSAEGGLPAQPRRVIPAVYLGCVSGLLASYLWRCAQLGLGHPMPWPDEGSFLWQAVAFQEHNSLLAPQLNPHRPIMWMPPGYMVVQGLIFKLSGFSLYWARGLSSLFMAGGAGLLAWHFWRLRARFACLLLCAVFLHSPIALLVGNVARMESLVFLISSGALLLLGRRRIGAGMALVLVLPLIHPNGLYIWLGGAAYLALTRLQDGARPRPSKAELALLGAALLLWLAYAAHVLQNLDAWTNDMTFQFNWKDALGSGAEVARRRLVLPSIAVPAAFLAAASAMAWKRRAPSLLLACFCAPLFALSVTSPGWLYDLYLAYAYLLFAVFLVEALATWTAPGVASALVLAVVLSAVGVGLAHRDGPLLRSVQRSAAIRRQPEIPYFESTDREAIRRALEEASQERQISVVFFPWAEALLFADLESDRLSLVQPTFHTHHADVLIFHESRYIPSWVRRGFLARVKQVQGVQRPVSDWPVLWERDGSERWRINQRGMDPPTESAP